MYVLNQSKSQILLVLKSRAAKRAFHIFECWNRSKIKSSQAVWTQKVNEKNQSLGVNSVWNYFLFKKTSLFSNFYVFGFLNYLTLRQNYQAYILQFKVKKLTQSKSKT